MRPDIYRVKEVGHGLLAIMAKPVSGEYIEDEFSGIAQEGVKQIVSLLEPHEEYAVGLREEASLSEKNGINFVSFPIPDRGLPSSVSNFSKITGELYSQVIDGKSTVVHCRAGIGRAGIVVVGILLHSGIEPEEAFSLVSKSRGVEVPDTEEQKQWVVSNCRAIVNRT